MKKLLKYLKGYTMESILAPLFKMLEATFELFVPLVMASIIDIGIGGGNQAYILKMGLILVALALVGLICSITAQYFSAKAAVGFSAAIRHALFEHVQKFSFTEMDTAGTSTLITRMTSDVNQAQNGVNMTPAPVPAVALYRLWRHGHGLQPSTQRPLWSSPPQFRSFPSSFSAS